MNSYSFFSSRRKAFVLLLCTGFITALPWEAVAASYDNGRAEMQVVQQQKQSVSGIVKDASGEPIIGANVMEKGISNGTITDMNGNFRLSVSADATLEISFIGYKTIEVAAAFDKPLNVMLQEDNEMLDEVVVVGYGSMKKKDLTGSVVQIKPDRLANENPNAVADILRGTAGLNISPNTSAKGGGDIVIRAQRSLGLGSTPLIILDGMIFYGELSEINPDDIGQIDVLKDASAAAVYGAKAANGVIIVTTKKGKVGKPTINLSANFGFNTRGTLEKQFSSEGYLQVYTDWKKSDTYGFDDNGNYTAYATKDKSGNLIAQPGYFDTPDAANRLYGLDETTWRYGENGRSWREVLANRLGFKDAVLKNFINGRTYDWYDNAFRTGFNQDYNMSISGAGDKMNYYLSLGYVDNESAYRDDNYSAVRVNMKISGKVNKWLEIGANVNFQDRSENNVTGVGSDIGNSPYSEHVNENGELVQYPFGDIVKKGSNYDFWKQYVDLESGVTVLNSIFTAKVSLPFNITYTFNAAPRYSWYYKRHFTSAEQPDTSPKDRGATRDWNKNFDWSLNNTINWDYTFAKKHHVILTLAQEAEEMRYWSNGQSAKNLQPSDALGFHNTSNTTSEFTSISTTDTHQTADALLARLFYSYDDRYMLTATVRRDGYSAFGASNPRATFPSVALAWNFTNEKFWKWSDILSTGKLRLSWGKNGNRSLSDPYISLADLGAGTGSVVQYLTPSGEIYNMKYLGVNRMANPNLRWEKTVSYNFGLDFGFLNDRITGSIDVYDMCTEDMVMSQPLPDFTGFGSIATNIGQVNNTGFEVQLSSRNITTKDFTWTTTANLSYNKNRIHHLFYEYEDIKDDQGNVIGSKEKDYSTSGWFINRPIGVIWDYEVTGIWQVNEAEEAEKYGQRPGDPKVWNNPANDEYNEDGTVKKYVYDDDDKIFLGNKTAPWHWSMRNEFTYKNLTFSFSLYSAMGFKRSSTAYLNNLNDGSSMLHNYNRPEREYWTPENPSNRYARIGAKGPYGQFMPNKWYNSSFVRLDNISVSYTLPKRWTQTIGVDNLRVFGNVRNVCTFGGDWDYGDPETGGFINRLFTLGISATL